MFARLIVCFVLFWSCVAHSDGLRGLTIGIPCAQAFASEVAQGSEPMRPISEIKADDLIGFHGTHDGHEVLIAYSCAGGVVTDQLMAFRLNTEVLAEKVFDQQYDALVDLFGAPCTDWRKLSLWQRFKLWVNGTYFPEFLTSVEWNLDGELQARLDTGARGPEPDYWLVSISIARPPLVLVREPNGSEHRVRLSQKYLHGM